MPKLHSTFTLLKNIFIGLSILLTGIAYGQINDSALKMVRELRLGHNLEAMSYRMSKLTTTYKVIVANVGLQKGDEMLKTELGFAVQRHQEEWDRNLAKAWSPLMSDNEFDSITVEKQKSPFIAKFVSLQNQAGMAMRVDSEQLLHRVMTEALTKAFEKSANQK